MAQIYGELIRAQLQSATSSSIGSTAPGLVYFNSDDKKLTLYDGAAWQKLVTETALTSSLSGKLDANAPITGSTKTKITYDSKGLVTAGADLTANDLPLITASKGGTGVANNDLATLTRSGNHALTLTTTATTSVTLPTSGTLATTADITAGNLTGTVAPSKGGTGVSNNNAATLTRTGNFDLNITTTAASAVTMPTSGTLATRAGVEQLTNKDIDGGTASNTSRLTLPKATKSTLDGLDRKEATLVFGTDTDKVYVDNGTNLQEIGGSGSGGTNYLQNWYDGSNPIGTVLEGVGGSVNSTASRPVANKNSWYVSSLINIEPANNTTNPLRSSGDILINSKTAVIGPSVETPMFQIDNADLGKPVSIQFDITGLLSSSTHDIVVIRYNSTGVHQEIISVAGTASTGTPASAYLPSGTTTFKGFFISSNTSTDYYSLRIRKLVAVDNDFQIDSLFVGPQSLAQCAVVTGWQSYTPAVTNLTTTSANQLGKYRRVGDSMEVLANITATGSSSGIIRVSIPSGFTIDTTKIPTNNQTVGAVKALRSGVSIYEGAVEINGTTDLQFYIADATPQAAGSTTPWTWQANDSISFHCTVPISQWSSGITTLADRAVEEYAYNTGTWNTASELSSFGYGPSGAAMGGALGQDSTKRVQFQSTILPTDKILVELSHDRNTWFEAPCMLNGAYTNPWIQISPGVTVGITWQYVSTTQINVIFGRYQNAYAADGTSTGNWPSTNAYWRVRKVSSGAAVGFPVSARNVVGDTSGTTVPAGYVGQVIQTSPAANVTLQTSGNFKDLCSISLTPGVWVISGTSILNTTGGTLSRIGAAISTTSNGTDTTGSSSLAIISQSATGGNHYINCGVRYLNISSNTTVYLEGFVDYSVAGSMQWLGNSNIQAIRIA